MTETLGARQKILDYMQNNTVSYGQLQVMTGFKKSDIYNAVNGKANNPKANEIILKLVQMFGLK